jgi:Transposase DDE domain/Tetratricopeptide repeat
MADAFVPLARDGDFADRRGGDRSVGGDTSPRPQRCRLGLLRGQPCRDGGVNVPNAAERTGATVMRDNGLLAPHRVGRTEPGSSWRMWCALRLVDPTIVPVGKQRNSRNENDEVKAGKTPEAWQKNPAKNRQKDKDARWTKKHDKSFYGYKNHVNADARHKLIRQYDVTDASVHDSRKFDGLLNQANTSSDVHADSAYRSAETEAKLSLRGLRSRIQTPWSTRSEHSSRAKWQSLNAQMMAVYKTGDLAKGTALAKQMLELARKKFGIRDPQTLTSLNNLAFLYNAQGRYGEAEPLYREALQGRREVLGLRWTLGSQVSKGRPSRFTFLRPPGLPSRPNRSTPATTGCCPTAGIAPGSKPIASGELAGHAAVVPNVVLRFVCGFRKIS